MAPILHFAPSSFWEYLLSLIIGMFFGYILHRSGFVSARKLTAIFYGKDWAVLRVMFTAILVAAVGLQYLHLLRIINLEFIYMPVTLIWPYLVGGLLFGIGFVIGGYCPGTAVIALANLRIDALVFLGGTVIGVLLHGWAQPHIAAFLSSGNLGRLTLSQALGIDPALLILIICCVAVAVFYLVRRAERAFNPEGKIYE